jgi:hypothetical protein
LPPKAGQVLVALAAQGFAALATQEQQNGPFTLEIHLF